MDIYTKVIVDALHVCIISRVSSGWFWRACLPHILVSPSVLLKQVAKFSFIWITQTPHYSTDVSEHFNHFLFFLIPLLAFHMYLWSTYHFLMSGLGFFSVTWNFASNPLASRAAPLPPPLHPLGCLHVLQGPTSVPVVRHCYWAALARGLLCLMSAYHRHRWLGS